MNHGRPTKYKEEYDQAIIDFVRNYESHACFIEDMAEHFDVCIDTLHEWSRVHPSFSYAFSRAKDLAAAKFRRWGCEHMVLGKERTFNGKAWEFVQENLDRAASNRRKKYKKLLSEGTHQEKVTKIAVELEDGQLELGEAERLVKIVKDERDISRATEAEERILKLEKSLGLLNDPV